MEYLDIVNEQGEPTGETVERTKAHAEGILHRTSHVWILRRREGRVQILLQKRCRDKDSYPGCYDISSAGHIPAGCGFEESAIRELWEELGVTAGEKDLIPCGRRTIRMDAVFHGKPFHDRQVSGVYALWLDWDEADFTVQESEVESVLWMDFDRCMTAVREGTIPNCIVPEELEMVKAGAI